MNGDFSEIKHHYAALEKSKLGVLVHVASLHSVLDVLYGGEAGRPMPAWTHQTCPEVGVTDQQHTGRCWIFATLAVLGHVFRSQYGISNHRASFSEGYLGFWDLYEKSRLFLQVAYDTRCLPLDDPSLSDLLKSGISDGGDYIFCLNLLNRYGIVPTEYYPNSSYGSMSTEALVTLINQVLRDNAITLRRTEDPSLIDSMLTNVFALLCMGLGTPPMPWKKLDWQLDQHETPAHYAHKMDAADALLAMVEDKTTPPAPTPSVTAPVSRPTPSTDPPQSTSLPRPASSTVPPQPLTARPAASGWSRPAAPITVPPVTQKAPISVSPPPKIPTVSTTATSELVASLSGPTQSRANFPSTAQSILDAANTDSPPPSPTGSIDSRATAVVGRKSLSELTDQIGAGDFDTPPTADVVPSTARIVGEDSQLLPSGVPDLKPAPKRVIDIPTRDSAVSGCLSIEGRGACRKPQSGFARFVDKLASGGCGRDTGCDVPRVGSGSFFGKDGDAGGCLLGKKTVCAGIKPCRLAFVAPISASFSTELADSPRHPKPSSRAKSTCPPTEEANEEDTLSFDFNPREFYSRFLTSVKYVPVVCDPRFPSGTRIISNDANMYGGRPSLYLNVTNADIEAYAIASLKRNIPVWFACDVKKQLTPEGGRMCGHNDRLNDLLPVPHEVGSKLDEIRHFNAIANHALLITAVSMKAGKADAWRIVNSWGDVGRHSGVFVACGEWFRDHVYSINAVYDTMSKQHRSDIDLKESRPTVRLGPFDPSVI